jgi:Xaa-Pro aminopeptidase
MYTRVLLGNLAIERCIFQKQSEITGSHMDALARQYLWRVKCDYGHGTGHGVGYYLNVHEGPHAISLINDVPLVHGMAVTNEPGYYLKDNFGIRIENILIVKEEDQYLGFENITFFPYDINLIEPSLLSEEDVKHINNYHAKVYQRISPYLVKDMLALNYLKRKTMPINTLKP